MSENDLHILYNASCPVCRFEIEHYAGHAGRHGLPLRFEDLNAADLSRWGITQDHAARRLHVLHEGRLLSGLDAFRALWSAMPRYRWLAGLSGLPLVRPVLAFVYDRLAAPLLYRAHLRRQRRAAPVPQPSR
jgi:predicted DCC family thiol-disulfide oxidoreductase YuxK